MFPVCLEDLLVEDKSNLAVVLQGICVHVYVFLMDEWKTKVHLVVLYNQSLVIQSAFCKALVTSKTLGRFL